MYDFLAACFSKNNIRMNEPHLVLAFSPFKNKPCDTELVVRMNFFNEMCHAPLCHPVRGFLGSQQKL